MTGENGQFVWRGFYKAWGRVEAKTPTQLEQNLRLQGQYYDAETYLHYNTFRYYDPGVGRFTTQDPIGLAGGVNLYRYAVNPTGWVDPEGQTTYNTMRSIPGFEKHHIIPQQLRAHPVLKAADFKIHELNNVIHLPKYAESHPVRTIHRGPHPSYSKK